MYALLWVISYWDANNLGDTPNSNFSRADPPKHLPLQKAFLLQSAHMSGLVGGRKFPDYEEEHCETNFVWEVSL